VRVDDSAAPSLPRAGVPHHTPHHGPRPGGSSDLRTLTSQRWLTEDRLAPLLIFIVLGALAWMTPAQNDTWWHLRSGREMWETGSLLRTERFSYTAGGAELRNYWWLSQLAFYGLFSLGGPMLLTVVAGACTFAAVYGSWRLTRGTWEARLVLLLFLLITTAPEWAVRPQVISLLLLVVSAHLLVSDRGHWLPLLCIVWANAHPQVIFGVLIAGAAALESLIWSRARFLRDALIAVCCAAAVVLSPDGLHYWSEALNTVSISRAVQLQEYRPPLDLPSIPFWSAVAVLCVMSIVRRTWVSRWQRSDRILLIAAALLAVASIGAARNIAFFALIAAPVLARLTSPQDAIEPKRQRAAGAAAYVLVAAVSLTLAIVVGTRWREGGEELGWRPLSPSVIEAVGRCPDPLFNQLEDGGPLMWALPSRRVFVDSRMNAYPLELLQRSREADLRGEYADLFRRYDIRCAVVHSDSPIAQRLALDPSMTTIASDRRHTIFQRIE
jgi:hypothetical protein